jgi:hypothetical protein
MSEYKVDRLTYIRLSNGDEIVGVVAAISENKYEGTKISMYRPMYVKLMPDMTGNKKPTLLAIPYVSPMLVDEQMFSFSDNHIMMHTDVLTEELEHVYDGFNQMFDAEDVEQEDEPNYEDEMDYDPETKKILH